MSRRISSRPVIGDAGFIAETSEDPSPPSAANPGTTRGGHLSPRERETLALLLAGLSDKEIAARLGISRHTVNEYTKSIYGRFGVHSRGSLLAHLLRRGAGSYP